MGTITSVNKSARNAVGDATSDVAARGEGKRAAAAADEATVRLKGGVSSVDEASRTTVWRIVTDEATAKRGSVNRRFRRSHRTAAAVIAFAENSVRTAVRDVVADEDLGRRESGTGDLLQTRSQDCRRMCRFCGPGLVRRKERRGDLPS